MRRKFVVYCEVCGSERPNVGEFRVFHHLTFCSVECVEEYRGADEVRRAAKETARSAEAA